MWYGAQGMFHSAIAFNQDISEWNTGKVTAMFVSYLQYVMAIFDLRICTRSFQHMKMYACTKLGVSYFVGEFCGCGIGYVYQRHSVQWRHIPLEYGECDAHASE